MIAIESLIMIAASVARSYLDTACESLALATATGNKPVVGTAVHQRHCQLPAQLSAHKIYKREESKDHREPLPAAGHSGGLPVRMALPHGQVSTAAALLFCEAVFTAFQSGLGKLPA